MDENDRVRKAEVLNDPVKAEWVVVRWDLERVLFVHPFPDWARNHDLANQLATVDYGVAKALLATHETNPQTESEQT